MQHLAHGNRCLCLANCHFSNLTRTVLRAAGERLWSWAELQRLGLGALEPRVLIAACSLVQVCSELFFLALTQPSLLLRHRCSSSSSQYRCSTDTMSYPEVRGPPLPSRRTRYWWNQMLKRSMRCGALSNVFSQLEWLLNCHCLV